MAKGGNARFTSYDELADLLESIEYLLKPLDIYTQIPPIPTMDEMVIKIMMEVLSTLALTTKDFKQGRRSGFLSLQHVTLLSATQRKS